MIKKSDLGISGDDFTINFSWTDNVHDKGDYQKFSGDIMDFYISGDVAPGGRFKYSYISTTENSGNKPTTPENPNTPEGSEETTSIITEDTSSIESDTDTTPTTDAPNTTDTEEFTPDVTEGGNDSTNEETSFTDSGESVVTDTESEITDSDTAEESQNTQNQSSNKKGCGSIVVASPVTIIAIGAYSAVRIKKK